VTFFFFIKTYYEKDLEKSIEVFAKMPPAARGSFEKPPLSVKHPQNFL
jgi:hypothetical protein